MAIEHLMLGDKELIISSQVVCDENCVWFDVKKLALNFNNKEAVHDAASNSYIRGPPICTEPKEDAESKGQLFVFTLVRRRSFTV